MLTARCSTGSLKSTAGGNGIEWTLVTRLPAAELDALRGDQAKATAALDAIVRQHGYRR